MIKQERKNIGFPFEIIIQVSLGIERLLILAQRKTGDSVTNPNLQGHFHE